MQCKNCKQALTEDAGYCNNCGAKVIKNRLTIKNLLSHFSEQFFNYDNALFITVRHMFIRPEEVIDSYITGTRKKYVNPVSFFAISITVAGLLIYLARKFFTDQFNMDFMGESMQQNQIVDPQQIFEFQTILAVLTIPLIAFFSKIVFFNIKKYNYTEHLVIYMYTTSILTFVNFISAIIVLSLGVNFFLYSYAFNLVMILFTAYCLKRIFKLSFGGIVLRTLGFLFLLLFFFIFFSILVAVVLYATGNAPNSPSP